MSRTRWQSRGGQLKGLTPLLDTIFLLLLVLIAISDTTHQRDPVRVRLPEVERSGTQTASAGPRLKITIDEQGGVFLEGTEKAFDQLEAMDEALRLSAAGALPEEVLIELRGDQGAPYGRVAELLQHLRLRGYQRVNLLASGKPGGPPPEDGP